MLITPMEDTAMTLQYQGRTFAVEQTGNETEPYRLVGKRGGSLVLVATSQRRGLFWVKQANGKINGGYVGQLADGSLIWLPTSGPQAFAAQQIWRANRAA